MIAYDRQTVDNPSLIKRMSHRARFGVAVEMMAPPDGATVLDYGTGDALLLSHLHRAYPRAQYIGYEPVTEMNEQARALLERTGTPARLLTQRSELQGLRCDRLSCMEVMEHLGAPQLTQAFADFRDLLRPEGRLMISVPVEIGLTALAKNAVRVASGQAQESTSFGTVFAAFLGRTASIPRVNRDGYIGSHLGFDYRTLRARLKDEGFVVEQEVFAPLPYVGALLNSQVFWLCRHA